MRREYVDEGKGARRNLQDLPGKEEQTESCKPMRDLKEAVVKVAA